ncbi:MULTISPECIES: MerR family transcriptional regulator [Paenibacillus]|uniref:MerR family transcriptional regulator n=1 Tax=Paenibacillus TaxID=44249 RepID=UPI00200367FC|nr:MULTISPECIES: MerR family transcriptional regulator [Paenibacillus]MCK6078391.1 MerR family transcriptional regulator [Paenibacillus silvae]MCK6152624.1 MerR family transcriptional regulator [Paenibacillus silvae]MCK6271198.1 MerR family transcriptional regulator [Paenibacillus silvae]MDT0125233.1 MerR family transcriptional regulator [Paenibacillus sp. RRE4]
MLQKYLTIGEFSKLTDLPSRTLHFYDRNGVLKPVKVDPQTNYRYYSVSQILDANLIKAFKFLGVPLNQIEEVQTYTPEELLRFLNKQEDVLEDKIRQINEVQKNLQIMKQNFTQQYIESASKEVYIKTFEKQNLLKITIRESSEIGVWSQVLNNVVQYHEQFHKQTIFGGVLPFESYQSYEEIKYDSIFIPVITEIEDKYLPSNIERITLEAGEYAVITFAIHSDDFMEMYNKLRNYVEKHKLNVASHIYEYFYPLNFKMNNASRFDIEFKIKILK